MPRVPFGFSQAPPREGRLAGLDAMTHTFPITPRDRRAAANEERHAGSRQGRGTLLGGSAAADAGLLPQGFAPTRLGDEESPRPRLRPGNRAHRDAGNRPRLLSGPDHRARTHRPFDRPAVAVL